MNRLGARVAMLASLAGCLAPLALGAQSTPKSRELSTDLGVVSTQGNTDVTTFNLAERLVLRAGRWTHKQQFGSVYGAEDGKQTSALLFLNWRTDLGFKKVLALFGYAGYDRNTFAGISRRFEQALGLAAKLVTTDANTWTFEAGLAANQQRSTSGSTQGFASVRSGTMLRHNFSKASYVFQSAEFLPSLEVREDFRLNTETGLVAPLSTHAAVKVGYVVRFDNLPEPGRRKGDRILTTGLQLNW